MSESEPRPSYDDETGAERGRAEQRGGAGGIEAERGAAGGASSEEKVDEAVEESFPASDPPSWSPGTAGPPPDVN